MTSAIQKNIYGMLSDLNRAKTMRIANQVLKQQQHITTSKREQVSSQGNAGQHLSDSKKINSIFGPATSTNRPSLQI